MICKICDYESSGKDFSNHLKKEHNLLSKEYTAKYIYNNVVGCKNCGKETRYVAFQFKKYCSDCSKIAMSEGGRKGGRYEAWNKGKTSKEDSRIKGQKGKENSFWGKKHSEETINRISFTKRLGNKEVLKRLLQRSDDFEILTPLEEYFSRQRQYLDFKCKKCNFICKKTLQAFERGSLCPKCYPIFRSKGEIEVYEFVKALVGESAKSNDRTLIKPKEIDIYVTDKHFGIEYNGLYWHSNLVDRTSKNELKNKTEKVLDQDAKLMHIFSDEWDFKKDICKSMIRSRLGLCERIWARKCKVKVLDTKTFNNFMNECHISGKVNSSIKLGLFFNNKLVAAIGFRKPRQNKWKDYWEISRFASQLNTNVVGGLSKLLKHFKTNYEGSIITYADRRFGEGLGYKKVGFQYVGNTGVDYWYSDGVQRFDRFMFKTDKNEKEIEKVAKLKLFKVWGCGSNIWVWD